MNPNSAHQLWSKWTFTITSSRAPARRDVETNCARFARRAWGSVGQMRVRFIPPAWIIEALVEGAAVHDPQYVAYMESAWIKFLRVGFGAQARVSVAAKLLAGAPQNGGPPDQLIVLPTITLG